MSERRKKEPSMFRAMLEERGIKDMQGIHDLVKELTAEVIQEALDVELEETLGYSKYDYKNKSTANSCNGYSKKTVNSSNGEIELNIPRDRESEFEPQLVKKHQSDISSIEDKIIFLLEWQNRPLKDVYALVILDAIHYEVQRCIVHQIRNCSRYVSYKDKKSFTADLKPIYKAVAEDAALSALAEFEAKWGEKYSLALRSWHTHWDEFAAMFKYSPQIRRIIYTTNAIENFNRQLRKVTKNKDAFVSDDALMKILYLATMNISDKWTMTVKGWGNILNNLIVHFGEQVKVNI